MKSIEGVKQIDDQIEVLPLSNFDDQIRWSAYRAIYGYGPLTRYQLGTHPAIHIIVVVVSPTTLPEPPALAAATMAAR